MREKGENERIQGRGRRKGKRKRTREKGDKERMQDGGRRKGEIEKK